MYLYTTISLPTPHSDEGVNFSIQKGIDASRSMVKYFAHNDMNHLEKLLSSQFEEDKNVNFIRCDFHDF